MPHISAVLFDYGLVLSGPPAPEAWARLRELLGAEEDAFHIAYWAPRLDYDRGTLNGESYWRTVAQQLGCELREDHLDALTEADTSLWTAPNEEMIAWAGRLQDAGYRTGILSNLGDRMEAGIRGRLPWLERFAHHTFSHRLGVVKPDAAIYRHAAEGLGLRPAEILFVDDREENVAGARAAGMHAVQYLSHDQFVRDMQAQGFGALLSADPPQP